MHRSVVAQILFNALLNPSNHDLTNKIKLKLFEACRRYLMMGDPLVAYKLDGSEILLPLSHNLPIYRNLFPQYSTNAARIARHVQAKYPNLTLIDIGANIGDTVAILRGLTHFPILCVEGNDRFFAILQKNVAQFKDVYIEHVFVGTATGPVKGHIDSRGGTARFVESTDSDQSVQMKRLSDILGTRPLFAHSKMIKIDTDGFDCSILRSELELLSDLKPVIFFEYDPHFFAPHRDDGVKIFESLRSIGYGTMLVYENNGDYVLTTELGNRSLIEDIHHFYSGRAGKRYCDICVFHQVDSELCQEVRFAEIAFFDRRRGAGS